jgi:hypothetical protein
MRTEVIGGWIDAEVYSSGGGARVWKMSGLGSRTVRREKETFHILQDI